MTKKLLIFLVIIATPFLLNAQCGPSYSDNANYENFTNSIGISFTADASCSGSLTSITIGAGFTPSSPTATVTARLYQGNGLGGTVLGELAGISANGLSTFDFAALMISMNSSTQYTFIVAKDNPAEFISTGRGFNTPWFPHYTGGSLYMNDVERPGEHLAFSVNIDDSTLGVNDVNTNDTQVKAYPNPATNSIQLTFLKQQQNYNIFDIYGKKVLEGIVKENEVINIEQLNKGIYFIQLEKKVLKFIKN